MDQFWNGVFKRLDEVIPAPASRVVNHRFAEAPVVEKFPKYLMKINGQRKFLSFERAYVMFDSGSDQVEFGRYVLEADFSVRKMTDEDREAISEAAERYSDSK
jgi:hypothetical protein